MPWQTAIFGFYRENSTTHVGNVTDEAVFQADTFGLRTAHAAEFAAGFVLAGHSLGALVARSMLETEPLPVLHFVSIAGVQNGLFVLSHFC